MHGVDLYWKGSLGRFLGLFRHHAAAAGTAMHVRVSFRPFACVVSSLLLFMLAVYPSL